MKYKIIIPKEEIKQESLEDVAERILANNIDGLRDVLQDDDLFFFYKGVIERYGEAMAEWQMDKQDNFIIGFLEFIEGTYSYSNIFDYWYLHADTSKTYTKKELLKKYIDTLNGN